MEVEAKLEAMGIELPKPGTPQGSYIGAVQVGNLLFVSGHGPTREANHIRGKVGRDVSLEDGQLAARLTMVALLGTVQRTLGDLDRVERIVKLGVFVNSDPSFSDQPKVANGASELMQEVFGEAGRHARSAVGVPVLPLGVAVEIDAIVAVKARV